MIYRSIGLILFVVMVAFAPGCKDKNENEQQQLSFTHSVPVGGNSWVVDNPSGNRNVIGDEGIVNWKDESFKIRTYFRVEQAGELHAGIVARVSSGTTKLKISIGNQSKEITLDNISPDTLAAGVFEIGEPGYHWVEFEGIEKSGETFADITNLLIGGEAASGEVYYIKEEFYWGRRGPSVHLGYQVPEEAGNVKYFYSEIMVPEGEDVIGSYFMANGFGQGYFGIQVNSPTERRVLFSVWSPYQTDNPEEIPDEEKIVLLKKGPDVYTGEFGNEGSGGQSFLRYNWKAGNTYRFLLKGEPAGNNHTDFTAWFYAPEEETWNLIASFRRPKTDTWLKGLYSFLENFIPDTGDQPRKAYYGNQWVFGSDNNWHELNRIKFTADATARKDARLDYAGGAEGDKFFLKNCGFFSEKAKIDTFFERQPSGTPPEIDFEALP